MNLNGYRRPRAKRYGGLAAIDLISAVDVLSVGYDGTDDNCVAITLRRGASFARYDFDEEGACYTETVVSSGGVCKTVHELRFSVPRLDSVSGSAVAEVVNASRDGLVVIVTTACGDRLLVGHTPELGAGFPLRLSAAAATTGNRSTDDTGRTMQLCCESVSFARTVI